ncbi:MAG: FAD-dependent oxidoreductase, partial [Alphaproteobacteria bacterium]
MSRIETEIAVIGGGIAGCSTALHVALRGVPVVLLEKRQAGAAASGVNFGGVRRNGRALVELELAARAIDIWHSLPELVGNDCEYAMTGHLKVARNDEDLEVMATHAEAQAAYGCAVEMISGNAFKALPLIISTAQPYAACASAWVAMTSKSSSLRA